MHVAACIEEGKKNMAYQGLTRPAPFGAETVYRIVSAAEALWNTAIEWNSARITRRELSRLSLHELEDIGLTPADIDRVARVTARRN